MRTISKKDLFKTGAEDEHGKRILTVKAPTPRVDPLVQAVESMSLATGQVAEQVAKVADQTANSTAMFNQELTKDREKSHAVMVKEMQAINSMICQELKKLGSGTSWTFTVERDRHGRIDKINAKAK